MPKKVYDILPPKLANKMENTIKAVGGGSKTKKRSKKPKSLPKEKRFPLREILFGGVIIFVLLGVYLSAKLPKANIEIQPKTDILTLQEKITIDKSAKELDLSKKIIPARYIEEKVDSWQEFPATGIASNEGKASGIIRIYNKTEPLAPLTLIKGTHFLSDSGKYFRTLEKITIPAAKYQKGKLVPGSVDAEVQAKEAGEDYNIGPSKFSVPKLAGTQYYYSIFAESDGNMQGGYKGEVKKVTKEDISSAKGELEKKLLNQAESSLRGNLSEGDILLEDNILKDIIDTSSTVKEGSIVDKFNVQSKVKVSALVFKKQDLEEFLEFYIPSKLSDDRSFLKESLNIVYNPESVDMKEGTANIGLELPVKTYKNIDTNNLIGLLSRKSSDQIKEIVDRKYGDSVFGLKVNFWPFWANKTPKDKDRIKIDLYFE